VAYLFFRSPPISSDVKAYGTWFGLRSAVNGVAQGLILPLAKTYINLGDASLALFGLLSKSAGLIVLGLSTTLFMLYSEVAVGVLSSLALASIRAMLSKSVDQDDQGEDKTMQETRRNVLNCRQIVRLVRRLRRHFRLARRSGFQQRVSGVQTGWLARRHLLGGRGRVDRSRRTDSLRSGAIDVQVFWFWVGGGRGILSAGVDQQRPQRRGLLLHHRQHHLPLIPIPVQSKC